MERINVMLDREEAKKATEKIMKEKGIFGLSALIRYLIKRYLKNK